MSRPEAYSQPLYFPKENPRGWHTAVAAKVRETRLQDISGDIKQQAERVIMQQEQAWTDVTGEHPHESSFTIIMPIHNEKKAFTSAFASLAMSHIPQSVPVDILLITNACNDGTEIIVSDELTKLGKTVKKVFDKDVADPKIAKTYEELRDGNKIYKHITTHTAGKANALNIGTELALLKGDQVAICIDANNYLEPDAISQLYGKAKKAFTEEDSQTVIVSGHSDSQDITSPLTPFIGRMKRKMDANRVLESPPVNGQLMAFDTEWIKNIGYVPKVTIEDTALGILAKTGNKDVSFTQDAVTWTYLDKTYSGAWEIRKRIAIGMRQLMELKPETRPILEDHVLTSSFEQRLSAAAGYIKENPRNLPLKVGSFLIWEALHYQVNKKLKNDFTNHSWTPLKTK